MSSCTTTQDGWVSGGRNVAPTNGTCSDPRCEPGTDDKGWLQVDLPDDFIVKGTFNETADKSHGYLPYGVGWYRKHFTVPAAFQSQAATMYVDFEGIQTQSQVWLNGQFLGSHYSGYTPSRYWLNASMLNWGPGADNVLAVRADATNPDGWWYDGGGIYRHVWLTVITTSGPYIAPWGVYAPSAVTGPITWDGTGSPHANAALYPSIEILTNASSPASQPFTIALTVVDQYGAVVGSSSGSGTVSASSPNGTVWTSPTIALPNADLWHVVAPPAKPALYTLVTTLSVGGVTVDTENVTFGVRSAVFNNATGFYLNGISTKILGTANHQDFAGLGVAIPDHLQFHRIAKLKEMGVNGWRTAHNPPNPGLLNAADELGFLVWDENHRNGQDDQIPLLVKRDRNHPSVVIWSLCNEVLCNTNDWVADALRLKALIKALDPLGGRPVSANQNGWVGANTPLDLQGFDYSTQNYDAWHATAPWIPDISSETSSAVSDRSEYTNDPVGGHVSGYDNNYPGWGESAEQAWGGVGISANQGILTRPFISGGWTWTGWDYKGEPTPYAWPDINSHFGILDEAGFPKDRFFWYKSWFPGFNPDPPTGHVSHADATPSPSSDSSLARIRSGHAVSEGAASPFLYVFPHWNWAPGSNVSVWAYSNADTVELWVNGVSLGAQSMPRFSHVQWDNIPYVPGSLYAAAYMNGSTTPVATQTVNTTGAPAALEISVKDGVGASMLAGCDDIALVQVAVVDANGLVVPTASNNVTFTVTGPATLAGTGNGDPACHTNDKDATRPAYHGWVLGVVAGGDSTGTVTVTASSPGFQTVSLQIPVTATPAGFSASWCHQQARL